MRKGKTVIEGREGGRGFFVVVVVVKDDVMSSMSAM